MSTDAASEINRFAARWWADRLDPQHTDKREALEREILTRLPEGNWFLKCDYDPWDQLLDAVQAAGIPCTGCLFSAQGIFPNKHTLERRDHTLYPKEGYGNHTEPITFGSENP